MVGYQAPAVQKAFQVLKTVIEAREGLGISKISKDLGYSKSTTHGLIQALLKVGALDRSPYQKKLYLGARFLELARKSDDYFNGVRKIQPLLDALYSHIDQTVFLGVLNQSRGTIIATSYNSKAISITASPGSTIPVLAGAVGKVFLSSLTDDKAKKLLSQKEMPGYTPNSIRSKSAYLKELQSVRANGYALDDQEYLDGVKAMAVYLGIYRGIPLVLWVVGFAGAMPDKEMPRIIAHTLDISKKVKALLVD